MFFLPSFPPSNYAKGAGSTSGTLASLYSCGLTPPPLSSLSRQRRKGGVLKFLGAFSSWNICHIPLFSRECSPFWNECCPIYCRRPRRGASLFSMERPRPAERGRREGRLFAGERRSVGLPLSLARLSRNAAFFALIWFFLLLRPDNFLHRPSLARPPALLLNHQNFYRALDLGPKELSSNVGTLAHLRTHGEYSTPLKE